MRIRENRTYAVWICMAGFLAGIVYANLPARNEIADMGIFQEHFFSRFSQADTMSAGFLWYVARIRLMPAGSGKERRLSCFCGQAFPAD